MTTIELNNNNCKEYTTEELEAKLDSLMNEETTTIEEAIENFDYEAIFAGCGDIPHTEESLALEAEIEAEKKEAAIEAAKYRKCGRCNGKGRIGHYHYVSNGVCFACDGKGKIYKG